MITYELSSKSKDRLHLMRATRMSDLTEDFGNAVLTYENPGAPTRIIAFTIESLNRMGYEAVPERIERKDDYTLNN